MIVITNGTSPFGRPVVQHLLKHVPAGEITVTTAETDAAADLAEMGIDVRQERFDPSLGAMAFGEGDRVQVPQDLAGPGVPQLQLIAALRLEHQGTAGGRHRPASPRRGNVSDGDPAVDRHLPDRRQATLGLRAPGVQDPDPDPVRGGRRNEDPGVPHQHARLGGAAGVEQERLVAPQHQLVPTPDDPIRRIPRRQLREVAVPHRAGRAVHDPQLLVAGQDQARFAGPGDLLRGCRRRRTRRLWP